MSMEKFHLKVALAVEYFAVWGRRVMSVVKFNFYHTYYIQTDINLKSSCEKEAACQSHKHSLLSQNLSVYSDARCMASHNHAVWLLKVRIIATTSILGNESISSSKSLGQSFTKISQTAAAVNRKKKKLPPS